MQLSVLDVGGVVEDTVELAPYVESLGYARYWIAEHPPQPTPIVIVAIVGGLCQRIRVGTAGILAHYYPPLRTAHDFQFLERAFEGRIDAGFCGAPDATLPEVEREGRDFRSLVNGYPDRVERLVRYLRNTPGEADYDPETAWPGALDDPPQIWSLGGGMRSASLAATHGLCFGFSLLYTNSVDDPGIVSVYRRTFRPARTQPAPRVALAVCGVCAATNEQAQSVAESLPGKFFTPRIVGSPKRCAAELRALHERYDADEIVFADLCRGIEARKQCYELLAAELGLAREQVARSLLDGGPCRSD